MGFKLDISVTRLRTGDSIEIEINSGSSFTVNVIASSLQTASLQVNDTSDILPTSNEWQVAVQRLAAVIGNDVGSVINVSTSQTVISIEFEDGTTFDGVTIVDSNGSLLVAVKTVGEQGGENNFNNPLVPFITVTDTTHELIEYVNYTPLNYPHGNMGDLIETVISFTAADSFSVLDFYYGWIDNSVVVYPSPGIFKINTSYFNDITTGALQKFTGDTSAINPVTPLSGNKVESIDLVNTGGNDYTLTIAHYADILPRPIDRTVDNQLNKPAEIETSLRFIFQIDLKTDLISPNPSESTTKQNLTAFISEGNIGYLGEVYQTGQQFYTLDSITWDNTEDELNNGLNTSATIELDKLTGTFNASHDVIVKLIELTDIYDQNKTLLQNINLDTVQIKLDTVPNSSTNLINVVGDFSGSTATITLDVVAGTIGTSYALWVAVADGTATKANQNVLVKVSDVVSIADDSTVVFGTFPSAPKAEYNYNMHYLDSVGDSFNEVKSYIDDIVLCRWRVQNLDIVNNTLNSFTFRIRSGNQIIESFTVSADDLSTGTYAKERIFNLLTGDTRKNIVVIDNGDGTYDFTYPFQITETMLNATNVVHETLATFTQDTAVGDISFTNNWISPTFNIGNYDQTKNGGGDPQVTAPPSNIKYYTEDGLTEVGRILNTGKTLVVATFEEDNLNDFNANPAAPFTYPDNTPLDNYLTAYFGLNDNNNAQGTYYRFHNLRDNEQSPFEQVPSLGGSYFARLERLDIDTAELTALLDSDKIKQKFGEDFECLKVTARLDRIQTGGVVAKAYKNDAYTEGYS
jgi:hypothetical protein